MNDRQAYVMILSINAVIGELKTEVRERFTSMRTIIIKTFKNVSMEIGRIIALLFC